MRPQADFIGISRKDCSAIRKVNCFSLLDLCNYHGSLTRRQEQCARAEATCAAPVESKLFPETGMAGRISRESHSHKEPKRKNRGCCDTKALTIKGLKLASLIRDECLCEGLASARGEQRASHVEQRDGETRQASPDN